MKTVSGLNDGFLPQRGEAGGEKVMRDILVRRGSDGGAGSVEVFEVQSQGRKFYRRLLFATHPEMAMHRPLVRVRPGDTLAQACCSHIFHLFITCLFITCLIHMTVFTHLYIPAIYTYTPPIHHTPYTIHTPNSPIHNPLCTYKQPINNLLTPSPRHAPARC